jgi:hypothetical protein
MMIKHEIYKPTWKTQSLKEGRYYIITDIDQEREGNFAIYVKKKERLEKNDLFNKHATDLVTLIFVSREGELVESGRLYITDLRYNYHKPVEITKEVAMIMGLDISKQPDQYEVE